VLREDTFLKKSSFGTFMSNNSRYLLVLRIFILLPKKKSMVSFHSYISVT